MIFFIGRGAPGRVRPGDTSLKEAEDIHAVGTPAPNRWQQFCNRFFLALIGSIVFGIVVFFTSDLFLEEQQGTPMLAAAGLLWCTCAVAAVRHVSFLNVGAVAAGLVWGFLLSLSAGVSIHNGRVSVNWPTMIPALFIIPLG